MDIIGEKVEREMIRETDLQRESLEIVAKEDLERIVESDIKKAEEDFERLRESYRNLS